MNEFVENCLDKFETGDGDDYTLHDFYEEISEEMDRIEKLNAKLSARLAFFTEISVHFRLV